MEIKTLLPLSLLSEGEKGCVVKLNGGRITAIISTGIINKERGSKFNKIPAVLQIYMY